MRWMLFVVVGLAVGGSGCIAGRSVTIPDGSSPALHQDLAGKTLECAGQKRETAVTAAIGAAGLSLTASVFGAYVSAVNPTPTVEQALSSAVIVLGLSATSLGLSIYAIYANYQASQDDQSAGRALSGHGLQGCSLGDAPVERAPPRVEPPAPTPPAAPTPDAPVAEQPAPPAP